MFRTTQLPNSPVPAPERREECAGRRREAVRGAEFLGFTWPRGSRRGPQAAFCSRVRDALGIGGAGL